MPSNISVNGISVHYQIDGPDNSPVVMLSNSLLSNYTMWDDQVDDLINAGYRILRYDTRGHGNTGAPDGPYSIKMFAEDAVGLMDALSIEKAHFVGLSMGGFIAQLMAVNYPERVISLSLCDTACVMPTAELWNDRIVTAKSKGTTGLADATLERWFTSGFHKSNPEEITRIRRMIEASNVSGYIGCAGAIRDMSQCDLLKEIHTPTIVIVGESDPACPVSSAETLHHGIAGSKLVILENAAHLPNIEKREDFNSTLISFLSSHL